MQSKAKAKGEIFKDYLKQKKQLFKLGKDPEGQFKGFIQEEVEQYKKKDRGMLLYDAIISKYTSSFNQTKRKKRAFNS